MSCAFTASSLSMHIHNVVIYSQAYISTQPFSTASLCVQEVGQKIKDALHAQSAAPVVVELDWKESVLHEDDR